MIYFDIKMISKVRLFCNRQKKLNYGLNAASISWWAMNQWLSSFAYRIPFHAGFFLAGGAAIIVITILTISIQAFKAAYTNPVKSLRAE